MSQTSGFESNRFYEAERTSVQLSQNDFAKDQNFDYLQEDSDLNEYLLDKNWDDFFSKPGPYAKRTCETSIANKIFDSVFEVFKFRMDTVQMFHVITDFYDVEAPWYYNKLLRAHRVRLKNDLTKRIGNIEKPKDAFYVCEDKIRMSFEALFKK